MKTKIKKMIAQVKHICSNANYKIRYNNLVKKYDELEKQYEELEKKLSAEYMNTQLKEAKKQAIMYKRQRDQIRLDYKDLQSSIAIKEV